MNYRITFSSYMYALYTVSAHRHFYFFFTLDTFPSGEDVNKNNGQTDIEQNDHADQNRIWPLKKQKTKTTLQTYIERVNH